MKLNNKLIKTYFSPLLVLLSLAPMGDTANANDPGTFIDYLMNKTKGEIGFYFESSKTGAVYSGKENSALFCASTFKVFNLAEFLLRAENDPENFYLSEQQVMSDDQRSLISPWAERVANGEIYTIENALDAMIQHSDNTGTDIIMRKVGADNVRNLAHRYNLKPLYIPNTTRQMLDEILGFEEGATPSWDEILERHENGPESEYRSPFTAKHRMATTPKVLAQFYKIALSEGFFSKRESREKFLETLSLPAAIKQLKPEGASLYIKGGSLTWLDYNVMAIGGAVVKDGHWVYFGIINNWIEGDEAKRAMDAKNFRAIVKEAIQVSLN